MSSVILYVYVTYFPNHKNWAVIGPNRECLFCGKVWQVDVWLNVHKDTHCEM